MKLKFIGTSSGQTNPNRNHSSLLFDLCSTKILIDCGDGISKALMQQNIAHHEIDKIIISHFHADHLAGLPSLLTQMIISKRTKPIDIFIPKGLLKTLQNFLHASFLFIDKYDFKINLTEFELDKKIKLGDNFNFIAKQNSHIRNKYDIRLDVFEFISVSFLFNVENKKIIYTSDVGGPEDLQIFNEIYPELFITETTHIELKEIKKFISSHNFKNAILTHINYSDEKSIFEWYQNLSKSLQDKIKIAEDNLEIDL